MNTISIDATEASISVQSRRYGSPVLSVSLDMDDEQIQDAINTLLGELGDATKDRLLRDLAGEIIAEERADAADDALRDQEQS